MSCPEDLIDRLALKPHPEGGYYRETYRAKGQTDPADPRHASRSHSTAIYYLLTAGSRSRLHKIASDEVWHFYLGDPLVVAQVRPETGEVSETRLGPDVAGGQQLQHVVPAGHWFGAYLPEGSQYALVGCTVAPGFDFADLVFAERDKMLAHFPQAREVILKLTD